MAGRGTNRRNEPGSVFLLVFTVGLYVQSVIRHAVNAKSGQFSTKNPGRSRKESLVAETCVALTGGRFSYLFEISVEIIRSNKDCRCVIFCK